jgi:hypothetical protein
MNEDAFNNYNINKAVQENSNKKKPSYSEKEHLEIKHEEKVILDRLNNNNNIFEENKPYVKRRRFSKDELIKKNKDFKKQ